MHSYYPEVSAALEAEGVRETHCEYGVRFPALVARGPLYGTQFHPEKSQGVGAPPPREFRAARGRGGA